MKTHRIGASAGAPKGKAWLLAGTAVAAMAAALAFAASPVLAADYTATDDASLRADITTANGDGAASSTITLGNDVTMLSTALPVATKDLTIDSGSFTFLKSYASGTANQGVLAFNGATTGVVTLRGRITGVSGGGNNIGQIALYLNSGTNIVNDAIATGGDGSGTGSGGIGVTIQNAATLTNNGAITAGNAAGAVGAGGAFMNGATLINGGTLQGGNGVSGGYGVSTSFSASTITNSGMIRAGDGTTGAGGNGATLSFGSSLTNATGATLQGGDGATGGAGVNATGTSAALTTSVSNSGTITGGKGASGAGGFGVSLGNFTTLSNTGAIIGGDGQTGGIGVSLGNTGPASLTNTGTILGGAGMGGLGGAGVVARSTTQPIINSGTIQGGNAAQGILITTVSSFVLTNSGTVQGGAGAAAIVGGSNANSSITITNSGALAAGAGYANAIETQNVTSTISLELHQGSVITGNVAANSGVTNTLTLGGDANASFDVSAVGPQYQNFTVFQKTGASVWSLTGAGTVATPWTISAGALQLGDGAADGSIIGDVTDNATFVFNNRGSTTYAGAISGAGAVVQAGGGTTILTGDSSGFTGVTTVSGGELRVDGVLGDATSSLSVASGGLLGGVGMVGGSAAIRTGGVVAPGNSIGTLHVGGFFTQAAGSTYQVQLDPNTSASDQIVVGGQATIASGANLLVARTAPGGYRLGTVYTVLTANGGVSGTYALSGDLASSAFLGLKDSYDANHVYLTVVQTRSLTDAAGTPNQEAVTGALPSGSPVSDALLNLPSDTAAQQAFDQLSGEAQAAAKGVLVNDSRLVRDLAMDRVRGMLCAPGTTDRALQEAKGCLDDHVQPTAWAQGFGAWGRSDSTANASGAHRSTGGFLIGADMPLTAAGRAGVFAGYSHTGVDVDSGEADIESYHAGAYGGLQRGPLGFRAGASFTYHAVDSTRSVAFTGFQDRLKGDYAAYTSQGYAEAGYALPILGPVSMEGFANVAYASVHSQGFTETGGPAALTAAAQDTGVTYATLGLRPSVGMTLPGAQVALRGMLGWRSAFGDITPVSRVAFSGGTPFSVAGVPLARNSAVAEFGADLRLSSRAVLGVTYAGQYSGRDVDQSVRAELSVRF